MVEIPHRILRSADVPSGRANWDEIQMFALTFNGYKRYPNDGCAKFAISLVRSFLAGKNGLEKLNLSRLRACLFYEQRRYRHLDVEPDKKPMKYIRALLRTIGSKLSEREVTEGLSEGWEGQKDALVRAVKTVWKRSEVKDKIAALKRKQADFEREDFVWRAILSGFSTMGNSRGYEGLMQNEANYSKVAYPALQKVSPRWRKEHIAKVFRSAGIRYAERKAGWLNENVNVMRKLGGLDSAKRELEGAYKMSGKIALLTTFKGISKKYARNMMMDVYHPEFQNCIAVDARIKKVSKALGLRFSTFEEEEQFYIASAKAARLQPWELDRVIYNFTNDVIHAF
jgi:hypothetical protein